MTHSSPKSPDEQVNALPLARIDSQDLIFSEPLREYLETRGVSVVAGNSSNIRLTYYLICGDSAFVKGIIASGLAPAEKIMFLVWRPTTSEVSLFLESDSKVVVIPTRALSQAEVQKIFRFLFTSVEQVLKLSEFGQEEGNAKTVEQKLPVAPRMTFNYSTPNLEQDKTRIGRIMGELFSGSGKKTVSSGGRLVGVSLLFCFVVFLAPFAWYFLGLVGSVGGVYLAAKQLAVGNNKRGEQIATWSDSVVNQQEALLGVAGAILAPFSLDQLVGPSERLVRVIDYAAKTEIAAAHFISQGRLFVDALLAPLVSSQSSQTPLLHLGNARLELSSVYTNLSLLQTHLQRLMGERVFPLDLWPGRAGMRAYLDIVTRGREQVSYLDQLFALYPLVSGFSDKQTYLLLLQNNSELRPTGGFIGSVGLLTMVDGKIAGMKISDVYDVDGQLKGHVPPPGPIREILAQEHWYLRDSNWHPDFAVSGQQAAWFYEKETGVHVDGVIAINAQMLVDLLRVTGPIDLSDYQDRISADNFFGKALHYTQKDFFPGSTQKRDFLGSLFTAVLDRITSAKGVKETTLFSVLTTALDHKDIQFWFTDPTSQQLVDRFGWAGRLTSQPVCQAGRQAICVYDPLAINEANLSVSKANYFVKRRDLREIVLNADGTSSQAVSLIYTHTATGTEEGVGQTYRAYVRFYLPQDAVITGVSFAGANVGLRLGGLGHLPVVPYAEDEGQEAGMRVLGVAVDIPARSEQTLRVRYERRLPLEFILGTATWRGSMEKQSGLAAPQFNMTIKYPISWVVKTPDGSTGFVAKDGQLEYNTILSHGESWSLQFQKQ